MSKSQITLKKTLETFLMLVSFIYTRTWLTRVTLYRWLPPIPSRKNSSHLYRKLTTTLQQMRMWQPQQLKNPQNQPNHRRQQLSPRNQNTRKEAPHLSCQSRQTMKCQPRERPQRPQQPLLLRLCPWCCCGYPEHWKKFQKKNMSGERKMHKHQIWLVCTVSCQN